MLCFLSGQVPAEPVASRKSGHVFEKRLLLAYLAQNQQRCPATGEELDAESDLLPLQPATSSSNSSSNSSSAAAALSPDGASVPQLLALFQSEWDAVVLESFTLKQHLEKTRQELSHALYQHDAACRVIARLNEENAALRGKLSARQSAGGEDVDMDGDASAANALSAEVVATVEAKQKQLAKQRKDFKKKDAPARAEKLAGLADWTVRSNHTLHDSDKPGVLCVAVDPKRPARVATGGVDRHVKVFDTAAQQIAATLTGHSKRVSHVAFHPSADLLVTASHDKTVKVWSPSDGGAGYSVAHSLEAHDNAVTAASIHATGDYLVSASSDASWGFHDLRSGKLLARYFLNGDAADAKGANAGNEALAVQFHPDGGIFATGAKNKLLQMWDVKSLANVATFDGHAAQVSSLCFSENGYQLASGSHDGVVKFWDLRKLKSYFEFDMNTIRKKIGGVHEVSYDASGTHLAVAVGAHVEVLKEVGKTEWQLAKSFDAAHKAAVTGVKFAPDSSFLASASMDRSLKIFR